MDRQLEGVDIDPIIDNSGLAEIQKAMEEIEKLKNQENQEVTEEIEEIQEKEEEKEEEEVEAATEEEEEVAPKKEKKEDKLWKIKKDKYRALAEKEALLKKVAEQEQLLNELLNSGTYHYSKSAHLDLEIAKASKKKAIEEGDIDALIEADVAINEALNSVNEVKKWTTTEPKNKQIQKEVEYEEPTLNVVEQEIASDWLDSHTYLQPTSRDYNPKLANQVADFINYLDGSLAKNNQQNQYFSEAYFETIERYIEDVKNAPQKVVRKPAAEAHIGSVRHSNTGIVNKASAPTQMILSADERRMCANAGISEKEWLRYKLEDLKKGK